MTDIRVIKTEPSSFEFSLNYKQGTTCNTVPFILNDCWNNCHLTFSIVKTTTCYNCYNTYNIKFTLKFEGKYSFYKNQNFDLFAYLNGSINGYIFKLNKINDYQFESKQETVYCSLLYNIPAYPVHIKINCPINNDADLLKQDMRDLLFNKTYTDIKLVVDEKVFNAHKAILFSRNKVLAKMIEDMHEKQIDTISLPGWDPIVVQELLQFIYSGKCDLTKTPHELFKLSHFLQIAELQELCKNYLKSNINITNLTKILELTKQSQYGLEDLDNAAKEFIQKNEAALAKDLDFINCLSNSINLNNITYTLKFSNQYDIKSLTSAAMKFVFSNYKQVFQNDECKEFLASNSALMFNVFEYLLDKHNTTGDAKTE